MRKYLKLTRAHTVPLETVPAAGGALIATGGQLTWGVLYWTLFGVMYHLVGYGHNSWTDWKNGHDKDDPNKQHHPLNTGEIDPGFATFLLTLSASLLVIYTVWGALPEGGATAVFLIILGITGAWLYNEKGKKTEYKFLLIATAHSTVFLIPYVALGGESLKVAGVGAASIFLWVTYQIAISGELKDVHQDESNFLHRFFVMGLNGHQKPGEALIYVSGGLRGAYLGSLVSLWILLGGESVLSLLVIITLGVLSIFMGIIMIKEHHMKRDLALRDMALIEFLSLAMFSVALTSVIGWITALLLIGLSVLWVVAMNRVTWGTWIKPDV